MRRLVQFLAMVLVAGGAWAAYQAAVPAPKPLVRFMPPGALLYLEAKDFGGLLSEWNSSAQKASWLKSDNYSVFQRSRLFLRLEAAQKQFATAAGLPPDMKFLTEVAGGQSALALYDIGKLEFVYVTHLPSAKSMQTAVWQLRSKFEPRSAAGANFYVHTDPESKRFVGFGATDEYLVLGTREDLVAAAIALVSGQQGRTLAQAEWYTKSVAAGPKQPGDLRMVLNLAEIAQTPQFRTYWIQQNITETRQYASGIVDLYRTSSQYREERTLLRDEGEDSEQSAGEESAQGQVTAEGAKAVADLVRFVPDDAGVYRALADPTAKELVRLITIKILTPHLGPGVVEHLASKLSPEGGESDLEVRIDQEPVARMSYDRSTDQLEAALQQAGIQAVLQVATTQQASNGVFVGTRHVLVFVSSADWNGAAVRSAMQTAIRPGLTAGELGVAWKQAGATYQLDGLVPVVVATSGKHLFVSNDAQMLASVMSRSAVASTAKPAVYLAGFDHQLERSNFLRLTSMVDRLSPEAPMETEQQAGATPDGAPAREPEFFSENLAGLSRTLADVKSESMVVRESGNRVRQTVTYVWSK